MSEEITKKGRAILVTGAGRGFGYALVCELLRDECETFAYVIACVRNATDASSYSSRVRIEGGIPAHRAACLRVEVLDVASSRSVAELSGRLDKHQHQWQVDTVINNAAIFTDRNVPVAGASPDEALETFNINALGCMRVCAELLPFHLLAEEYSMPLIVNISGEMGSIERVVDFPSKALNYGYRMSKAALNMLTRCLSIEFEGRAIIVSLHPGWMQTRMGGESAPLSEFDCAKSLVAHLIGPVGVGIRSPCLSGAFVDNSLNRMPF